MISIRQAQFETPRAFTADDPLFYTDPGLVFTLYLLLIVIVTDIAAYFTGRLTGGPKLAPKISPGKTWAGFAGGIVAAGLASSVFGSFQYYTIDSNASNIPQQPFQLDWEVITVSFFVGLFFSLLAQAGDLFESWIKRKAGVKDSGKLLPGHGGLLDRIDGLLFTVPVFWILVKLLTAPCNDC